MYLTTCRISWQTLTSFRNINDLKQALRDDEQAALTNIRSICWKVRVQNNQNDVVASNRDLSGLSIVPECGSILMAPDVGGLKVGLRFPSRTPPSSDRQPR